MLKLISRVRKRINSIILSIIFTGIVFFLLGILIITTDLVLKLMVGLFVLALSYVCFHLAWKIRTIKKDIEKHFNL